MKMLSNHEEAFKKWLSDGKTWIGIFENLLEEGSEANYSRAERFAMPFDDDLWDAAKIREMKAPDTPQFGTGWRYLLIAKVRTVEEALAAMEGEGNAGPS
jgi:hypothetical protein